MLRERYDFWAGYNMIGQPKNAHNFWYLLGSLANLMTNWAAWHKLHHDMVGSHRHLPDSQKVAVRGQLPKTKPKNLYEWWDGKLCKWEIPRCMMYSGCKRKFDVVAFENKYNKSLSNTSSKSGAKRPKKWENLYNICRSQSICVIPRMIKVKFWSTSILCNATQADLYLGLGTDIQI